jgi:hypothetical protein
MNNVDKFAAEQSLWIAHRSILLTRGIDPAQWAEQQSEKLAWPEAPRCFAELSQKK